MHRARTTERKRSASHYAGIGVSTAGTHSVRETPSSSSASRPGELVAARSGPPSSGAFGCDFGFCPIVRLRLAGFENFLGLKAGRHRSRRAGQHLMMLDIEQPQPTLLAQRKPDHATELDQFRLREMASHALPELVAGVEPPNDGLGIGERRLLTFVIFRRLLEIQKIEHLLFDQGAARGRLHRALVAAIFAGDRARNVEAAQFLDRVIEDAVAENVVPGIGEKPKTGGHMCTNGRAFRPRRAFALTALHFRPHFEVHFFKRDVADPLLGHFLTLLWTFAHSPLRRNLPWPKYSRNRGQAMPLPSQHPGWCPYCSSQNR